MIKSSISLLKVYLLIATVAGLFGTLIFYGIFVYSILEYNILTSDEYIQNRFYREIEQCSQGPRNERLSKTEPVAQEDQEKCIADKKERLLTTRSTDFKMTLLRGGVRGTIFLILFVFHYPKFKKVTSNE